jgi:phosphate-selective porin OprO/OprP
MRFPLRNELHRQSRPRLAGATRVLVALALVWMLHGLPRSMASEMPPVPDGPAIDAAVVRALAEAEIPSTVVPLIERDDGPWERFAQNPSANPLRRPNLDPAQAGNIDRGAGRIFEGGGDDGPRTPVLDPGQIGNLDIRLEEARSRLEKLEGKTEQLPLIRLSGFFQVDDGLFSQPPASQAYYGDIQDGVGFRRARLSAVGKLTEFTNFSIEFDFAQIGRPSFFDVWGEQEQIPILGTVRIGQFRQPGTMDAWTSVRHLEFLERSAAFQATDPFRRVGIMAYSMSEDERTSWAYSVYATGLTFWDGTQNVYQTFGDNRAGAEIGDRGGVGFASRITHLLDYDDLTDGRYLTHVGTGFVYGQVGGTGATGASASTYRSLIFPEFFVGDPAGQGLTAAGTPRVLDSGRILTDNFWMTHVELARNAGPAHFQTEVMLEGFNQFGGPTTFVPAAYFQCGYFLTGESVLYLKQPGVLDYNVVPYTTFFGTGRRGRVAGMGAWEVAFRWTYVDLSCTNINPVNQLSNSPGPPPAPGYGTYNAPTLALNWWWNRFTRVQFNWIHAMPDVRGQGPLPFDIFGTRFQIEF